MLEIISLIVGQLQTNCYLVVGGKTNKALIIDPGDDADYIERIISDRKLKPVKIVATHGHFDHILAVTELKLAYKIPFFIHKNDEFLVKELQSSVRYFLGIAADPPPNIDGYLQEKDYIMIGESTLLVLEAPGHTPGGICLYSKRDKILFTGDLLFADGGIGRTDFLYSNPAMLNTSLKKIFQLNLLTTVYSGHGRATTLKVEIAFHKTL